METEYEGQLSERKPRSGKWRCLSCVGKLHWYANNLGRHIGQVHPGLLSGEFESRDGELITVKTLRPGMRIAEYRTSEADESDAVRDLRAQLDDTKLRLRDQKAQTKRWRSLAKRGPDVEQVRILAAMAMPGIHELIHLGEVPRPCAACPIQSE